jgi:hypothetical protein
LKRESKRQARAAKEEAEAYSNRQREALKALVEEAKEEGFPVDVEEKEAYFMNEVARGEQLAQDGMNPALKTYIIHVWRAMAAPRHLPVGASPSTNISSPILTSFCF